MPDPRTPNLGLYVPLNGADVGTWDVPMNANFNALDTAICGISTIAVSNITIVLSPSQYNCGFLIFTGAPQTADIQVIFPAISRIWTVLNATNTTSFAVQCAVTGAGPGNYVVALPPGEVVMISSDTLNMRFVALGGRIGSYMDIAATGMPAWINFCDPKPYLNCDGTSFSSATYPILTGYLGGTTLPDARGRLRYALDQGTGRISAYPGFLGGGGQQTIPQVCLPNYNLTVTDPSHTHSISDPAHTHAASGFVYNITNDGTTYGWAAGTDISAIKSNSFLNNTDAATTGIANAAAVTGITVNSGGSGTAFSTPCLTAGLTLIRAG